MQLNIRKNPAEEAEKLKAQYASECKERLKSEWTFCKKAVDLMTKAGWDYNKFETRTTIDRKIYYRIYNGKLENPKLNTVLKICIGLRLRQRERDELIELAGHKWLNNKKHFYYQRIFDDFIINTPSDFNDVYAIFFPDEPKPFKNDGK